MEIFYPNLARGNLEPRTQFVFSKKTLFSCFRCVTRCTAWTSCCIWQSSMILWNTFEHRKMLWEKLRWVPICIFLTPSLFHSLSKHSPSSPPHFSSIMPSNLPLDHFQTGLFFAVCIVWGWEFLVVLPLSFVRCPVSAHVEKTWSWICALPYDASAEISLHSCAEAVKVIQT